MKDNSSTLRIKEAILSLGLFQAPVRQIAPHLDAARGFLSISANRLVQAFGSQEGNGKVAVLRLEHQESSPAFATVVAKGGWEDDGGQC